MSEQPSTRERLIEATIEVIERDGEAGVRLDRIAAAAGVTKASIYHFFEDRDGLVTAALAEAYRRVMRRGFGGLEAALACETRDDYLHLLLADIPSFTSAEGAAARRKRIQILGSAVTRPRLQAAIRAVHQDTGNELAQFVAYGQQRGWISERFEAIVIAEWWLGLILGRHVLDDYSHDADDPGWVDATLTALRAILSIDSDASLSAGVDTAPSTP